jgi:hypothetical protein
VSRASERSDGEVAGSSPGASGVLFFAVELFFDLER